MDSSKKRQRSHSPHSVIPQAVPQQEYSATTPVDNFVDTHIAGLVPVGPLEVVDGPYLFQNREIATLITAEPDVRVHVQPMMLPNFSVGPPPPPAMVTPQSRLAWINKHTGAYCFYFQGHLDAPLLLFRLPPYLQQLAGNCAELRANHHNHRNRMGKEPRDSAHWTTGLVEGYAYSNAQLPNNVLECPPWVSAIMSFFRSLGFPVTEALGLAYRNMRNGISAHADDEGQFDRSRPVSRSVIGAVFGEARRAMRFSPFGKSTRMVDVVIPGGWAYVMYGNFQARFYHSITQSSPRPLLTRLKALLISPIDGVLLPGWPTVLGQDNEEEAEVREGSATSLAFCNWLSDALFETPALLDTLQLSASDRAKLVQFCKVRYSLTLRCFEK